MTQQIKSDENRKTDYQIWNDLLDKVEPSRQLSLESNPFIKEIKELFCEGYRQAESEYIQQIADKNKEVERLEHDKAMLVQQHNAMMTEIQSLQDQSESLRKEVSVKDDILSDYISANRSLAMLNTNLSAQHSSLIESLKGLVPTYFEDTPMIYYTTLKSLIEKAEK